MEEAGLSVPQIIRSVCNGSASKTVESLESLRRLIPALTLGDWGTALCWMF